MRERARVDTLALLGAALAQAEVQMLMTKPYAAYADADAAKASSTLSLPLRTLLVFKVAIKN